MRRRSRPALCRLSIIPDRDIVVTVPLEREVILSANQATEDRLRALASNHALESLTIWGGALTGDGFVPLAQLTQLKSLLLGEMPIDHGILRYLSPLHKLEVLGLVYTNIEGDFTPLTGLPLREIRLEGSRRVGDRCARMLAQFSTLRNLEIHMTSVTDDGLVHLEDLPLEVLWLGGPRISDVAMRAVAGMTGMRHLDVCCRRVTDEGVRAIDSLTKLEVLWLSGCGITDASVDVLAGFRRLRELSVNNTGVTAAGKARLRTLLPHCKVVEPEAAGA